MKDLEEMVMDLEKAWKCQSLKKWEPCYKNVKILKQLIGVENKT